MTPSELFRRFQFALHERLVHHHLDRDVGQLTSLPRFDMFPHRLEVLLHSIDADRDTVDQRKRPRVLGEHWREHVANGQDDG
jgi:hypothetical protein